MSTHTVALTQESFAEKIASGIVFVDFWAEWCGPCRAFAPIYEAVAQRHQDCVFAKVDTEAQEALGEQYEVESIPTLMAFKDGEVVFRQSGAVPATTLEAIVNRVKAIDVAALNASREATERSLKGERPKGVPADATWDAGDREWCAGPKDKDGKKHGLWKYWRPDGTLCNECPYVHGQPHGPFKRFHENGEVSNEGTFENGKLQGTRRWLASTGYTTERMHENGVSDRVRVTEMDYDHDRVVAIRHFNAEGVRCLPSTGEAYPERPKGVPPTAEFNEQRSQWQVVVVDGEGQRHGFCQFYEQGGALLWEADYVHGVRQGRWVEAVVGEFADPAVVTLKGSCEQDASVGIWSGLDAAGKTSFVRDLGVRVEEATLAASPVFLNEGKTANEWRALAKDAFGAKHYGEGLLASARAAATDRAFKPLDDALRRLVLPRNEQSGLGVAQSVAEHEGESLTALADALVRGGDSGLLLRQLAILMDQRNRPRAALDFINAAIMLHPEETKALHFTRALILISLGLEAHARADAESLTKQGSPSGQYVKVYLDSLFPTYGFWPAQLTPSSTYDGLPEAPEQPLAAIVAVARKYATRLMMYRDAMLLRFKPGGSFPWLPPDLSKLLPDGPVPLETKQFTPDAEGDEAPEPVDIDETLDLGRLDLPDLLRGARADWNALTWLLWATGQADLTLPKKLSPPKSFGQAAGMAAQRLWRARDRRVTNRTFDDHQVPGFDWHGVDIDQVPPNLAGIAEQQYAELQALFYWLADASNRSPWQDNLRGS